MQNGSLVMSSGDVKSIFDPVVRQILILIQTHKDENPNVLSDPKLPILLVGGFGESRYLRDKIQEKWPEAEVLQPPEA